jgi:hypothetical protein
MIKDYETLKKHCNVNYKINDANIKIGDLSDNQLNISKHILNRKITLNKQEKQQLDALNYIIDYRSKFAEIKMQNNLSDCYNKRLVTKATRKADIIMDWIKKSYK